MGIISSWEDFIAGWIAGIGSLLIGHPLDTLKVRQQIHKKSLAFAMRKTFTTEGVTGFYKGIYLPMLLIGPSNAVFFGVYGNCTRYAQNNKGEKRILLEDPNWKAIVYCSGCIAGFSQVFVTTPMELVKILLQMQTQSPIDANYKGVIDCLKKVYTSRGLPGIFRGIVPTLYRDAPTCGIYTLSYEVIVNHEFGISEPKLFKQILAGGTAGLLSWIFIMPFDVVKSRMQGDCIHRPKYSGFYDCFYKSYKADGWKVFTKGMGATVIKAFPSNAAMFVIYEKSLEVFQYIKKL